MKHTGTIVDVGSRLEHLLDEGVVGKLQEIGRESNDQGFAEAVVGLYMEHTPQLLEELETACERDDWDKIRYITHRLKGSSLSVGAKSIAQVCEMLRVEAPAKSSFLRRWELLGRLKLFYEITATHFRKLLHH